MLDCKYIILIDGLNHLILVVEYFSLHSFFNPPKHTIDVSYLACCCGSVAALGSSLASSEAAGAAAGVGVGAEAGAAAGVAVDVEPESCTGGLGASEAGGTGAAAAAAVAAVVVAAAAGLALVPFKVKVQSDSWAQ